MRVLVTGVAGFIGSWAAEALLRRGDTVVGVDNFDRFYAREIKERNLRAVASSQRTSHFVFHEGDILDATLVSRVFDGRIDCLLHLAALAGVRPSIREPERYMRVNVEGTTRLLEACRRHGVAQAVVASSSSVYGARSHTPFSEDDPCNRPESPYAASKRATELVCATYSQLYGMKATCLRYFTVYGPRQRPEMAIHAFVRRALSGDTIPLFGDGESARDYTFIDDAVGGTLAAIDRPQEGFSVYNVGGATPTPLGRLVEAIAEATGREVQVAHQPWQAGDVPITCADTRKAARDLGYERQIPLREGLAQFVGWYRKTFGL